MDNLQSQPIEETGVRIQADGITLEGRLGIPDGAHGIVLFAHGSGHHHMSLRSRHVARRLNEAGLATLRMDLLSPQEENIDQVTGRLRFDIGLLAARLGVATAWIQSEPGIQQLRVGYIGASTGAAAALLAAADNPDQVGAVVSRGGRPDLAGDALPRVRAPTLLIVGGYDAPVAMLNTAALAQLKCDRDFAVVPDATHHFEEPGALDEVARLARQWFLRYLGGPGWHGLPGPEAAAAWKH